MHWRKMMAGVTATLSALAISSASTAQITVFDNFGLGWDYQWNMGWSVSGAESGNLFGIEQMMGFVPARGGVVSDIWVAMSYAASDPGYDAVTLRLVTDNDGRPGAVLEEWVITEFEDWYQWNEPIHLQASGLTYLHADQQYWLWAQADPPTWVMWAFNTIMDVGPIAWRIEGQYWAPVFWDMHSAFRVDVEIEPEPLECPGDVNSDGVVNTSDLLALLAAWGQTGNVPEDVNGDGVVNTSDLLALLAAWGECPSYPQGACCLWDGTCVDATEHECIVMGPGVWFEGETCQDITCPEQPLGACCFWPSGDCLDLTEYECVSQAGLWEGQGTSCETVECPAQAEPDFSVTAPYTSPMRTTCGAGDDCAQDTSEDHVYEVTINDDGYWDFSLCDSLYDTKLYVGTEYCMGDVGSNDDACGDGTQSELVVYVEAGIYYVTIEGYNGACGNYILDIFPGEPPTGACCVDIDCVATTSEEECDALDGTWYQGETCPEFNCPEPCPEAVITIEIFTDDYPEETTWEIVEHGVGVIASGGPYADPGTLYIERICVGFDRCFDFTIFDVYGDGICCSYGYGYYAIYYEDELVAFGGEFGLSETVPDFGGYCPPPTGACCVDLECVATTEEAECDALGGAWYEGETCPEFDCPEPCVAGNGPADGDNGTRPVESWNLGIMEDAVLDAEAVVSMIHSEFIDLTTPVGTPSALTQQEFRIYDLAQGDGTIEGLDPMTAVPLLTVVLETGINATKTICGGPFFGGDVECWDGVFEALVLPAGRYGLWFRFPGAGAAEYYFATADDAPNSTSPSMCHVWGMNGNEEPVNAPAWRHVSFCLR